MLASYRMDRRWLTSSVWFQDQLSIYDCSKWVRWMEQWIEGNDALALVVAIMLRHRSSLNFRVLEKSTEPVVCSSVSEHYHQKWLIGSIRNGQVERRRRPTAKEMLGFCLDSVYYEAKPAKERACIPRDNYCCIGATITQVNIAQSYTSLLNYGHISSLMTV